MSSASPLHNESSEPEIFMERILDAPRELVFEAWTNPDHLSKWWGPRGFTNPVCDLDVRPGGKWRVEQRSPDGNVYPFKGIYLEVVRPERLVYTFGMEGMYEDKTIVDYLTFEDLGGKTKLIMRTRFDSAEDRDAMLATGMEQGANETMDRLAEHLAQLQSV